MEPKRIEFKNGFPDNEWKKEEYKFAVSVLKNASRDDLLELFEEMNIRFSIKDSYQTATEEELISIILSDADKHKLLDKLKEKIK